MINRNIMHFEHACIGMSQSAIFVAMVTACAKFIGAITTVLEKQLAGKCGLPANMPTHFLFAKLGTWKNVSSCPYTIVGHAHG